MSKPRQREQAPITPNYDAVWRDSSWRQSLRRRLLRWYDRNARDLPWRAEPTPYRVWVSEIMLQQTQVATVIPYYHRFLESFPTVEALASADDHDLMNHWEGLGYYRRARSMHAAAKQIVRDHEGEFPSTFDHVLALPGVGRYTAGAILSIAFDMQLPVLEGNTQRVFSRWVALRGTSPTEAPANQLLWEIAETMLPRKHPGSFNQAAMELGALICTPKQPKCTECPVTELCGARARGLQEQIPGKVSRVDYEDRTEFALVVARKQTNSQQDEAFRYLLRQIPEGRRWAGLWDFPRTTEAAFDSVADAAGQLSREVGVKISPGIRLTTIKHAVTKYRISLHVHAAKLTQPAGKSGKSVRQSLRVDGPWQYLSVAEMENLPMSVTGRRIAKMLADDRQARLPLS